MLHKYFYYPNIIGWCNNVFHFVSHLQQKCHSYWLGNCYSFYYGQDLPVSQPFSIPSLQIALRNWETSYTVKTVNSYTTNTNKVVKFLYGGWLCHIWYTLGFKNLQDFHQILSIYIQSTSTLVSVQVFPVYFNQMLFYSYSLITILCIYLVFHSWITFILWDSSTYHRYLFIEKISRALKSSNMPYKYLGQENNDCITHLHI